MNKQELIETYKRISNFCEAISINKVIQELEQLDEPQKVQVPQFVADWYEEHKEELEFNIWAWIKYTQEEKIKNRQVTEWLAECENAPVETLIKMKLFGYEVEKEKRFLVKIKGIEENINCLNYDYSLSEWYLADEVSNSIIRTHHTRDELEQANFGWVFDCPGVEIEEV